MLKVPRVGRFGFTHFASRFLLTWSSLPLITSTTYEFRRIEAGQTKHRIFVTIRHAYGSP
jgi:hypothetical protein